MKKAKRKQVKQKVSIKFLEKSLGYGKYFDDKFSIKDSINKKKYTIDPNRYFLVKTYKHYNRKH